MKTQTKANTSNETGVRVTLALAQASTSVPLEVREVRWPVPGNSSSSLQKKRMLRHVRTKKIAVHPIYPFGDSRRSGEGEEEKQTSLYDLPVYHDFLESEARQSDQDRALSALWAHADGLSTIASLTATGPVNRDISSDNSAKDWARVSDRVRERGGETGSEEQEFFPDDPELSSMLKIGSKYKFTLIHSRDVNGYDSTSSSYTSERGRATSIIGDGPALSLAHMSSSHSLTLSQHIPTVPGRVRATLVDGKLMEESVWPETTDETADKITPPTGRWNKDRYPGYTPDLENGQSTSFQSWKMSSTDGMTDVLDDQTPSRSQPLLESPLKTPERKFLIKNVNNISKNWDVEMESLFRETADLGKVYAAHRT